MNTPNVTGLPRTRAVLPPLALSVPSFLQPT